MNVLVIDIGGSHVKMKVSGAGESRRFPSGRGLTAHDCVARVRAMVADWTYDVVSLGYPGQVTEAGPALEPGNLAAGWVGFDYEQAFGCPVRIVNDAVMQALGGYTGGRMLFLGLGTGLGSALVSEHVVIPLELGTLPWLPTGTVAEWIGRDGLERSGHDRWMRDVAGVTQTLRCALLADYVLLGGGNATRVDPLPEGVRRGGNEDAFEGGFRLWEDFVEPHDRRPLHVWRVLR